MSTHNNSNKYKETAVQYYLAEDKSQEEVCKILFDHQVFEPKALYSSDSDELVRCVIFGQTCDSIDIIVEDIMLPYPKLNDILLFQHMGAYSLTSAEGRFNGFLCAEIDYQP